MNTNSKIKAENIKEQFKSLFNKKTKEEELRLESYLLMASFLSEIELILEKRRLTKANLAIQIGISPSYLTQVFKGDKPLNFVTLAKIQKALDIQFVTRVYSKGGNSVEKNGARITKSITNSKRITARAI